MNFVELDDAAFQQEAGTEEVYRLASVASHVRDLFPELEDDEAGVLDTLLTSISQIMNASDLVLRSFLPSAGYDTPFPVGRFGDGSWPVYYSARDLDTAAKEVAFHCDAQMNSGETYYYQELIADFIGQRWLLVGQETTLPALVSIDKAGYATCQEIARRALQISLSALLAPSARNRPNGQTVPVFDKDSLSNPRLGIQVLLEKGDAGVRHRPLSAGTELSTLTNVSLQPASAPIDAGNAVPPPLAANGPQNAETEPEAMPEQAAAQGYGSPPETVHSPAEDGPVVSERPQLGSDTPIPPQPLTTTATDVDPIASATKAGDGAT